MLTSSARVTVSLSGSSVSLSSNGLTLAIGAPSNVNENGDASGHVRVYRWSGTAWMQKGGDVDGASAGDKFGGSVSVSGDGSVLVVGALGNAEAGTNAGEARVYRWTGSAWEPSGVTLFGEEANDRFGSSVAVSGDGGTMVVGARGVAAGRAAVYSCGV